MSERLVRVLPDEMSEAQREVYDAITGGDRGRGTQHFPLTAPDGSLHGPFGIMLHAPSVGLALQQLGSTIRFHTALTPRIREIAILQVAQSTGSEFERWAHEPIARSVGLTDDDLVQLRRGRVALEDPREAAVTRLCAALLASEGTSDDDYAATAAVLPPEQMIELTVLVGYYWTLAQLLALFEVGPPADQTPPPD